MSLAIRSAFGIVIIILVELLLLGLGTWQLYRLDYKKQLIDKIAELELVQPLRSMPSPLVYYAKVELKGKLDYAKPIYLYHLDKKGKPGYELILPLVRDDGVILVKFPNKTLGQVQDDVRNNAIFTGKLLPFGNKSYFTPANNMGQNLWYYLDQDELKLYTGHNLASAVVADDPVSIQNNHFVYAITWYCLAFIFLIIFLIKRITNY